MNRKPQTLTTPTHTLPIPAHPSLVQLDFHGVEELCEELFLQLADVDAREAALPEAAVLVVEGGDLEGRVEDYELR